MTPRHLIIAGAIWTAGAARLATQGGLAAPTVALVKPFTLRAGACPGVARIVAARLEVRP
jgi:hypothetical protein